MSEGRMEMKASTGDVVGFRRVEELQNVVIKTFNFSVSSEFDCVVRIEVSFEQNPIQFRGPLLQNH